MLGFENGNFFFWAEPVAKAALWSGSHFLVRRPVTQVEKGRVGANAKQNKGEVGFLKAGDIAFGDFYGKYIFKVNKKAPSSSV